MTIAGATKYFLSKINMCQISNQCKNYSNHIMYKCIKKIIINYEKYILNFVDFLQNFLVKFV